MIAFRAFLVWCAIIPLVVANGAFRDAVLTKLIGAVPARLCSGEGGDIWPIVLVVVALSPLIAALLRYRAEP